MLLKVYLAVLLLQGLALSSPSSASSSSEEEEDAGSSEKESGEHRHPKGKHHPHWGYDGQDKWSADFQHCSGQSQSPINIEPHKAIYTPSLPPITLDGYDLTSGPSLMLLNNGHTLQLSLPNTMRIVSGFDQPYLAAQLHFHWGTVEVPGSEHTIDNIHFPAEIHVVHYNSKYADLSEAATKPDGLAVLGGFIGVGLHENENYEKILSVLTDVSAEESKVEIQGFNVRHLLPNHLERFYRYNGSLTTPPCYQTVNWTMFNDTITVSRRQLAALEDTLHADQSRHAHLNKNFRAPQLLHGRRVLASFPDEPMQRGRGVSPYFESDAGPANTHAITGYRGLEGLSRGDILAIAFGALFVVTLLVFTAYAYRQRKKYSLKKDSRQNVIYKPATKEDA